MIGSERGRSSTPALLAILVLMGAAAPSIAASDTDWAYQLPHELMSPFCRGSTLAACTSSQAEELRLWILTQAAAGASRGEVESQLIARFGDDVRAIPRAEGWGATTFAVPLAALVLGGGVVAFALRRMVRSERDESPDLAPVAAAAASSREDLARRIDAELEA